MNEKIIQIIPAPTWLRVQFDIDGGGKDIAPVLCLALVEDRELDRYVRPMYIDVEGCVDFADDFSNGFDKMLFEENER